MPVYRHNTNYTIIVSLHSFICVSSKPSSSQEVREEEEVDSITNRDMEDSPIKKCPKLQKPRKTAAKAKADPASLHT